MKNLISEFSPYKIQICQCNMLQIVTSAFEIIIKKYNHALVSPHHLSKGIQKVENFL